MSFVSHPNPEYQADAYNRSETSLLISTASSTALSGTTPSAASLSTNLSVTTSTANSG